MLARLSPKIGAAALAALALLYMVVSLVTGHSARAEAPVDLAPAEAGLDVWRALALMVDHPGQVAVVDVRPAHRYELYHLAAAVRRPEASAAEIREAGAGRAYLVVVADTDAEAEKLVAGLAADGVQARFLEGGVADWYLKLELPAPLFSTKPPPHGYASSIQTVQAWLAEPSAVPAKRVRQAIDTLARLGFSPDQLAGKQQAPAGKKRKKISGGCG